MEGINRGRVLVYGKFKVVHPGHMRLFKQALDLGDYLIVGIIPETETDEYVEFSKTLIQSLPFVNQVVVAIDAPSLIRKVRPQLIVKGFEYRHVDLPEKDTIDDVGAKVIYSSGQTFISEHDLIDSSEFRKAILRPIPKDFVKRNRLKAGEIFDVVEKFSSLNVTVVGDVILDEYIACQTLGMSGEDPVLVNTPISSTKYVGGAGIVAAHCSALGARTRLISVVGSDPAAGWIKNELKNYGVEFRNQTDSARPTTLKQRFKNGKHTLFRLSQLTQKPVEVVLQDLIELDARKAILDSDVLIFSDFSYGVLEFPLTKKLIEIARESKTFISADSQSSSQVGNLSKFEGCDLVCATEREARLELRNNEDGIAVVASKLRQRLRAKRLFLKMGADGVLLDGISHDGKTTIDTDRIPALNLNPIDVSGAGDSMLAVASLSLAAGADTHQSAVISSIAAAIQVGRNGNLPISSTDLKNQLINAGQSFI